MTQGRPSSVSHDPGFAASDPSISSSSEGAVYGTYFLGRYRVVDEIGVGGMASVHLARMDGAGGFQKWVAIKRIHPHLIEDEQFIHMFLDEARIAARISHPNVAQVFDLGVHENTYWIAMEYLHGEPLREIMRHNEETHRAMPPQLAARIIADAAEGLHAAHELRGKRGEPLNLVHRDVSPHNLFLTYDGMVKVVDFGIAKVSGRLSSTRAGTLKGKLAYMAPEQVRGATIDRRTDIFALGVVLWELVTGRRLFRMDTDLETLEKVQSCVVPSPSSVHGNVPAELESVIMRTLQKSVDVRFQTARELSRALQQYLMHAGHVIGPEEVSAYVTSLFGDRIQKREAHLRWAAEVTQTISIEDLGKLEGAGRTSPTFDEISVVSYQTQAPSAQALAATAAALTSRPPRVAAAQERPTAPPPRPATRANALPPPAHGIHMPAPRVRPEIAAPAAASVVISNPPLVPTQNEDDEEEEIATIVVPSRLALESQSGERGPLPAAGSPAPAPFNSRSAPTLPPGRYAAAWGVQSGPPAPVPTMTMNAMPNFPTVPTGGGPAPFVPPGVMPSGERSGSLAALSAVAPPVNGFPQHTMRSLSPRPADETQHLSSFRKSHLVVYVAAAVATFFVVVGIAAVILVRSKGVVHAEPAVPAVSNPAQVATAPTDTATATAAPATAQPSVDAVATAAASATSAGALPSAPNSATAAKTAAKPPATGPTHTGATGGTKPPATATATAPDKTEPVEPGFLTVVCTPFCDQVVAGARNLGPSPVMRVAMPPGQYRVVLKRTGGATKVIPSIIVSGQVTSHRIKMD